MPKMRKKSDLPQKICRVCGLPFAWRKKWERSWPNVQFCSERCKKSIKSKKTRKKFSQLLILKANRLVGLIIRVGCLDGSFGKEIRDQYFN